MLNDFCTIAERLAVSSLDISENVGTIHEFYSKNGLFGWCYAIDGGYKGCNPYIERHLAIFVNCFLSRAN